MTVVVTNARALLRLFARSDWKDVHVRTADGEIFIARMDGGRNPMLGGPEPAITVDYGDVESAAAAALADAILAPHVGTVASVLAQGTPVKAGDVVAHLEVLDRRVEIFSASHGVVAAVLTTLGAFIEYGSPLLRLTPASVPDSASGVSP